jgi:hypothetical protein
MNLYWLVAAGLAYVASGYVLGLIRVFDNDRDIYRTLTIRRSLRERVWVAVENVRYVIGR